MIGGSDGQQYETELDFMMGNPVPQEEAKVVKTADKQGKGSDLDGPYAQYTDVDEKTRKDLAWDTSYLSQRDPGLHEGTPEEFQERLNGIIDQSQEDINKQYSESSNFGEEVTGNDFLKKEVEVISAGLTSPEEKLIAITSFVKRNFTWDETNWKIPTSSLRKVLDDKKGNSADLNILLASMLNKAGISVQLVLLSTRDHGFVREQTPISSQFNYVVCLASIDNKGILLDATEKLLPIGMLPQKCLNGNGFEKNEPQICSRHVQWSSD